MTGPAPRRFIAFYQPEGAHPPAALARALAAAGYESRVASIMRPAMASRAAQEQDRLLRAYGRERPLLWLTYLDQQAAPDLLGRPVAQQIGVPYVVFDAMDEEADRQAHRTAYGAADVILSVNATPDTFRRMGAGKAKFFALKPFVDAQAYSRAQAKAKSHRKEWAARLGLDPSPRVRWIIFDPAAARRLKAIEFQDAIILSLEGREDEEKISLLAAADIYAGLGHDPHPYLAAMAAQCACLAPDVAVLRRGLPSAGVFWFAAQEVGPALNALLNNNAAYKSARLGQHETCLHHDIVAAAHSLAQAFASLGARRV